MTRRDYGDGRLIERAAGRWQLVIELPPEPLTGKRRRRHEAVKGTKREAQRRLRELLDERDHGVVRPDKITAAEWLTLYLDRRVRDQEVGPRTEENYRAIIRIHLGPLIGNVKLQDLRVEHVLLVRDTVSADRAPATTKKVLGFLHQALAAAVVAQLMALNPAAAVPAPSLGSSTRERRALAEEEIIELLATAEATLHDAPIRFALATGIRQGELLGAQWSTIDFDAGTFEVTATLATIEGETVLRRPKTRNSRRTIDLSPATLTLLRQHRAAQNAQRLMLGAVWQDWDLMFPSVSGKPWSRHTLLDGFQRLLNQTQIPDQESINWHTLRHSAASLWIKAGVDIFTVSRRLGHGSPGFTMSTYAHLMRGQQRQAAEALDHLIG